jgi:hypothetical protein
MSIPVSPPRPSASALRRGSWLDPNLRVGDAERAEVTDRLAKHFSDGRLDHAEFSERMDRAMRAKTMADLTGLLADLPETQPLTPPPVPAGGRRHQRKMLKLQLQRERLQLKHEQRAYRHAERRQRMRALRWVPLLAAMLIMLAVVVHTLTHSVGAWLLLGLIAFVWLRHHSSGGYGGS